MNVACVIVGIDNWEALTLPLVESIQQHEPAADIVVVDNGSYPIYPSPKGFEIQMVRTIRTVCYSKAINIGASRYLHQGKQIEGDGPIWDQSRYEFDWLIVLSNDVLCCGPFVDILKRLPPGALYGPKVLQNPALYMVRYPEGWCVAIGRDVWEAVGPWDEDYPRATAEDLDYGYRAQMAGYRVKQVDLPFVHLDARQRFEDGMIDAYAVWAGALFERKHDIPPPMRRYAPIGVVDSRWGI